MDPFESSSHSFIVKIWREREGRGGNRVTWRGRITHVPDGAFAPLVRLEEMVFFVMPYLRRLGVQTEVGWRMALGLRALVRRMKKGA